jgi:hypothetical protein
MIAQQPQGGLGQVSQPPQARPAALPQGKPKTDQSADADRIAAEQITAQDEPFDVNKEITNLNKGRMQLDAQIQKMQESLAKRTELPYDPRFMALGVGLAQPTKTGQFVESLGQGMGGFQKATTDEATRQQELGTQNLDLMMKQQQLRQKLASSAYNQTLLGQQSGMPSQGGATLGGLAVPVGGAPASGMPSSRPGLPTTVTGLPPISRQQLFASQDIGDEANTKFLERVQKAEIEQKKASDAGFTEVTIPTTNKKIRVRTEIADKFDIVAKEAAQTGDEQLLIRFMVESNMIPPIGRKTNAQGQIEYARPKTELEEAAEKTTQEAIARERATASEKAGNALLQRGEIAPKLENLANNILSLTDSNTRAFNLMQDATVRDAVLRAIEQGANINVGSMSVGINLPVRIALQGNKEYRLTKDDITALQMFQQTQAEITAEMRKIGREPGEGATDKTEGQLYAALGVLPSDSARALALKAEAMVQRGRFDARAAQLWLKAQEEFPNKSFSSFKLNDPEFKELQKNYRQTLDDMRNKNADILRTSPKTPAPAAGQSGGERKPPKGWKKMPDGSFEKE